MANGATLRAKLRVDSVVHHKDSKGETSMEIVKLVAVYSDKEGSENKKWSTWTPSATFEMQINNPSAIGKLRQGQEYYVDLTLVEKEQ